MLLPKVINKQTNKQTSKQASNVLSPLGTLNIKFILTKKIYSYKEERDREREWERWEKKLLADAKDIYHFSGLKFV